MHIIAAPSSQHDRFTDRITPNNYLLGAPTTPPNKVQMVMTRQVNMWPSRD
jgi:hypothetical protein